MCQISNIQLTPFTILNIPINTYDNDFIFIVNGQEFRTSRLVSDLISSKISKMHFSDPTMNEFHIKTREPGDFSKILNLTYFDQINIPEEELPFIIEIIEILGINSLKYTTNKPPVEITQDNVFSLLQQHQKCKNLFKTEICNEIDFLSSNFSSLVQKNEENLLELSIDTLCQVIENKKLKLFDEDQLLRFINKLYLQNSENSILYEKVIFTNVSTSGIDEFVKIFFFTDLTKNLWDRLSFRLRQQINSIENDQKNDRYDKKDESDKYLTFSPSEEHPFCGILRHIKSKSGENEKSEVTVSSSSIYNQYCQPGNVTLFNDPNKFYLSQNAPSSWLSFDFKEHRVIPSHYTIKSGKWNPNNDHPKSWVIEGSNDQTTWKIVDVQKNCTFLNGNGLVHTFEVQVKNDSEYRYVRMRLTAPNWSNKNCLAFDSFELYGKLI